jgi:hypothetical protein
LSSSSPPDDTSPHFAHEESTWAVTDSTSEKAEEKTEYHAQFFWKVEVDTSSLDALMADYD